MRGLLIKDIQLLRRQSGFLGMLGVMLVLILVTRSEDYFYFMSSYVTFMLSVFTMNTLSYDEYDNGMPFLLSLPVMRRSYVLEKYLFGILLTGGGWLLCLAVQLLYAVRFSWDKCQEILCMQPVYLFLVLIFVGYFLPICLKLGTEKGRLFSLGFMGVIAVLVYLLAKSGIRMPALEAVNELFTGSPLALAGILAALCASFLAGSCLLSLKIMEKREF